MENKKAMQLIMERIAVDTELKAKVLASDEKGFMEELKANGFAEITEEKAQVILEKVKAAFSAEDGKLSDDALNNVVGGRLISCICTTVGYSCESVC